MTNTNDKKIIELKKQVELKKKEIKKAKRFSPITNCSIEVDGVRHNINVLNKTQLVDLLVKLTMYKIASESLKIKYSISGYSVNDWIEDINSKLDLINVKEEENNLKSMEDKLDMLLSNEKKVELELDEIESLLK